MDFLQETRQKIKEYACEIERLGEMIYNEANLMGNYGEESQHIQELNRPVLMSARALQKYVEDKIAENDG